MDITGLGAAFDFGSKIIDKIFPDPQKKQEAQIELLKLNQSGQLAQLNAELQLALAQAATNTEEAKSTNWFVAGWRPFVGWVCGFGLAYQFIVRPIATGISMAVGHPVEFPTLDMGTLISLLFGLLGLGGMRMAEKMQGVART